MRSQRTLALNDHDTALALAVLTGAVCACGRPAGRVIIERPQQPARDVLKTRRWSLTASTFKDEGAVVRTWCGSSDDDHVLSYEQDASISDATLAMHEDDL